MERKITITLTQKQTILLEMVCDRYCRLIEGQLENSLQEICESAWEKTHERKNRSCGISTPEWYEMRHKLEERLKEMQEDYWGLTGGRYNGIGYDKTADTLWDMHQVLRYARYCNMPPEKQELMRMTTISNKPTRISDEPLIEVEYQK